MRPAPLRFGVYPFGAAAGPDGVIAGRPDDPSLVARALDELAGGAAPLLLRAHVVFDGSVETALAQAAQYVGIGAVVDLSLSFHDRSGDVDAWCEFVETVVRRHGSAVAAIGITNEANLVNVPFAPDGAYPNALEALIRGAQAAARASRDTAATAAIGFTAGSDFGPAAASFWAQLGREGGEAFAAAVKFAGLTMYPGGFGPQSPAPAAVGERAAMMLAGYRAQLSQAGISDTVPIRVSESGWPTGPGRSEHLQAEMLRTIVRTVAGLRDEVGVTHWELFTLRDADSGGHDVFGHLGVLRDDYTPKPAYGALRDLIAEFGVA